MKKIEVADEKDEEEGDEENVENLVVKEVLTTKA